MPSPGTPLRLLGVLCVLTWALALSACAKKAPMDRGAMAPASEAPMPMDAAAGMEELQHDAPASPKRVSLPPEAEPRARMVHYRGHLRLRSTSPRDTIDEAVGIAEAADGYVEELGQGRVVLRVPVTRFQEVFHRLLPLGDVLRREVTAQDVTEAYTAADLRLRTARAARDRLRDLLTRAAGEEQKVALLREIQRLTLEIDQIEARLRHLESLAAYSTIVLEVEARQALAARGEDDLAAFRWIRRLDPFQRTVADEGDPLELTVPEGMVRLDARGLFVAESADRAAFWASERENHPRGDTGFWLDALETRLAPEFESAEIVEAGEFRVLRLVDRSEKAYRYLIGVRADGDALQVVEVYYPGASQEERYGEAVLASLAGGAG